jgi:hypothetical protein
MTQQTGSPAYPAPSTCPESISETRNSSPRRGSTAQDLLQSNDQRDAIHLPEFSVTQSLRGRLVQRRLSFVPSAVDDELYRHYSNNTYTLVRQEPRWYDWYVKIWEREISIKVDAKHRRDHLGTTATVQSVALANNSCDCSSRKNLHGILENLTRSIDDGSHHQPTLSASAYLQSRERFWFLCDRHSARGMLHNRSYYCLITRRH